jgi:two-component system, sensor histidine kinase
MGGTYRILVVEDSAVNQALLEAMFRKTGPVEAVFVDNGMDAIERALAESFDLILMDIRMPGMDGCEATQVMRDRGVTTPILALTADACEQTRERCFQVGCTDFLTKPLGLEKLQELLQFYVPVR